MGICYIIWIWCVWHWTLKPSFSFSFQETCFIQLRTQHHIIYLSSKVIPQDLHCRSTSSPFPPSQAEIHSFGQSSWQWDWNPSTPLLMAPTVLAAVVACNWLWHSIYQAWYDHFSALSPASLICIFRVSAVLPIWMFIPMNSRPGWFVEPCSTNQYSV